MFRIIGGDSTQYGPASVEEIREWIRVGRASAQTLAQRDGETEWTPLSVLPEFADAFLGASLDSDPAAAETPGATSLLPARWESSVDPDRLAEEAAARSPGLAIRDALGRGWSLLMDDFWPIVGISALALLVLAAANSALVGVVVAGPIFGGWKWYLLKRVRRQPTKVADLFFGFTTGFLQLLLAYLVSSLLTGLGLILCLLPGIYLAVAWQFAFLLILDKGLDFWPALEVSRKVITREWWSFLAFAIVIWLLNLAGVLCCVVGAFVTIPWTLLALVCLYEDRFGRSGSEPATPSVIS